MKMRTWIISLYLLLQYCVFRVIIKCLHPRVLILRVVLSVVYEWLTFVGEYLCEYFIKSVFHWQINN